MSLLTLVREALLQMQQFESNALHILPCAFTVELDSLVVVVAKACHELVPPDAMTAVLRQLVDAFVHDRARPEVMTLGLKTVRELCARMPLIMTPELLQVTTPPSLARKWCAWPILLSSLGGSTGNSAILEGLMQPFCIITALRGTVRTECQIC